MKSLIYFLILVNGMVIFNVHAQLDRSHIVWPAQGGRTDTNQKPLPTATLTKNHYQKIIIPKNETYALEVDSVHIDTLILKDKSTLKCMNSNSMVIIDNALIGEKCTFDAAGTNGVNGNSNEMDGSPGSEGRNITIAVVFVELKSLVINTSGGKGGDGATGRQGGGGQSGAIGFNDGARGQSGGNGGNGGNGGSLKLWYASRGFIPTFNGKGQHTIQLKFNGGNGGSFGMGGKGGDAGQSQSWLNGSTGASGKPGTYGTPGSSGLDGKDGELILERLKN